MIEEVKAWQCTCDGCGKGYDIEGNQEAMIWKFKEDLMGWLGQEEDWKEISGKWYCSDCWAVDEEGEYVPDKNK